MSRTLCRRALAAGVLAMLAAPGAASAADAPLRASSTFTDPAVSSMMGLYALGDPNADGYDDVFIQSGPNFSELVGHIVLGAPGGGSVVAGQSSRAIKVDRPTLARGAGDVNGDGIDDVTVLTQTADGTSQQGVLFGRRGSAFDPATMQGIRVVGDGAIQGVGDVNGDGRADLLASHNAEDPDLGGIQDRLGIIYGRASTAPIDLDDPESYDVPFSGFGSGLNAPIDHADINGDGLEDLLLTPEYDAVSVVFGQRTASPIDLAELGAGGYRVTNIDIGLVVAAGDVNGDGRDDIGTYPMYQEGPAIVFGKATPGDIDAATAPRLQTTANLNGISAMLAPVGDVDGNGRDDVAIGAIRPDLTSLEGGDEPRVPHLVRGQASAGSVAVTAELRIPGTTFDAFVWTGLHAAGDVDGDGTLDLMANTFTATADGSVDGSVTFLTRRPDRVAPRLRGFAPGPKIEPASFRVGPGATSIQAGTTEEGTLEMVVRRGGVSLGTVRFGMTLGTRASWNGRLYGLPLPAGNYRATFTPVDRAGNRGAPWSVPFAIRP